MHTFIHYTPHTRLILTLSQTNLSFRLFAVLRQAASKMPTKMEFISRATPPRLGNLLIQPPKAEQGEILEVMQGAAVIGEVRAVDGEVVAS